MSMGLLLDEYGPAAPGAIDLPTLMKCSLPHADAITRQRRIVAAAFNVWQPSWVRHKPTWV